MDNRVFFGKLSEKPFSFLLFDLWNSRKSGKLSIKNVQNETTLFFEEGSIAVTAETFKEKTFFSDLAEKDIITGSSLENILAQAKAVHELRLELLAKYGEDHVHQEK